MNNYDKYYRKGGDYVIPVEIFNDLLGELEELHNKIDKAIEYIDDNAAVYAFNNKDLPHWEFNDDEIKILLKILKDSDVDE